MSIELIASCKCGNTDEFVSNAYKLLFPDSELPEIVSGRVALRSYARDLDEKYKEMITALVDSLEPFGYYFSDKNGVWDLLAGRQVC